MGTLIRLAEIDASLVKVYFLNPKPSLNLVIFLVGWPGDRGLVCLQKDSQPGYSFSVYVCSVSPKGTFASIPSKRRVLISD